MLAKLVMFFVVLIGIPILLVFLLHAEIFSYASGEVESWITFWGSYIGAIFGASAVYFVSRFQIKKQYEQQIKAIEIENTHSTKREMKQFYLTNKLEKIEEMQEILNNLYTITIDINNELVEFAVHKEALEKKIQSNRNVDFIEGIYKLRTNLQKNYFKATSELVRFSVLSEYVKDVNPSFSFIQYEFLELYDEVKECYYSDEMYKEYLIKPDEPYISENADRVFKKITYLREAFLQNELKTILNEIEEYIK
ncbi:hypothetical protein [Lysinibacillus agricola]|uniref:hypothetical protein n=1 Tax=Lysinibacillus agricola TaxID=2590012 RepID=UPI003C1B7770